MSAISFHTHPTVIPISKDLHENGKDLNTPQNAEHFNQGQIASQYFDTLIQSMLILLIVLIMFCIGSVSTANGMQKMKAYSSTARVTKYLPKTINN